MLSSETMMCYELSPAQEGSIGFDLLLTRTVWKSFHIPVNQCEAIIDGVWLC